MVKQANDTDHEPARVQRAPGQGTSRKATKRRNAKARKEADAESKEKTRVQQVVQQMVDMELDDNNALFRPQDIQPGEVYDITDEAGKTLFEARSMQTQTDGLAAIVPMDELIAMFRKHTM